MNQYNKTPDFELKQDIEIYDWVVDDNIYFEYFSDSADKLSKIDKCLANEFQVMFGSDSNW